MKFVQFKILQNLLRKDWGITSTHKHTITKCQSDLMQIELHIYGSSRLGMVQPNEEMIGAPVRSDVGHLEMTRGIKVYELSNHLGNVLSVVTDQKLIIENTSPGTVHHYLAEVISYTDYYQFGSPMAERIWEGDYRYGFNGKEKDDDMAVDGGSYDFGARMYDGRLGRWWSVDPEFTDYPFVSGYSSMLNNPLMYLDSEGRSIIPADAASLAALSTFVNNAFASSPLMINYLMNGTGVGDYGINGNYQSAVQGIAPAPIPGAPPGMPAPQPGFVGSTDFRAFEQLLASEVANGNISPDQQELAQLFAALQNHDEAVVISVGTAATTVATVEANLFVTGGGGTVGDRVNTSIPPATADNSNGVVGVQRFEGSVVDAFGFLENSITIIDQALAGNRMNEQAGGTAVFDINDRIAFALGESFAQIAAPKGQVNPSQKTATVSCANVAFQVVNGYERMANGAAANQFTGTDLNPNGGVCPENLPAVTDPNYVP